MSIAEQLLVELKKAHPLSREFVYERIERDHGKGFASVVRAEFEKQAKKKSRTE
jgi:hypothetical protein